MDAAWCGVEWGSTPAETGRPSRRPQLGIVSGVRPAGRMRLRTGTHRNAPTLRVNDRWNSGGGLEVSEAQSGAVSRG